VIRFLQKLVVISAVVFVHQAHAQSDAPPNEPPFIQENTEFDDAQKIENEVKDQPGATSVPSSPSFQPAPAMGAAATAAAKSKRATPTKNVNNENPNDGTVLQDTGDGVKYIHHPDAAKGLQIIEPDGTYVYRTQEKKDYSQTGSFRLGMMPPPHITATDDQNRTFEVVYTSSNVPVIMFDYEWQPLTGLGRLGIQAGFGAVYAQGHGIFKNTGTSYDGKEAQEKYTFLAVPLTVGAIYRLEWMSKQWFAPYVSGGGTYYGVMELRDDGKTNAVGSPGVYAAGGMLFNVTAFDHTTSFTLSNEYGISNLWVSAEYRQIQTFREDVDFSSGVISLGVTVDY
jgi:hypothetical protein